MAGVELSFKTLLDRGVSDNAVQMLKNAPMWFTARTETGVRIPALWQLSLPLTFPAVDLEPFLAVLWIAAVAHYKDHEAAVVRKKEKKVLFLTLTASPSLD